jgi:GWxTD domain-containing protein
MVHRRLFSAVLMAGVLILLGSSCASRTRVQTEPSRKSYYDEVRQIMPDDEARVFKSLPDEKSRAEFIREFWAVRDPNPETPENEARVEFEKRARYAALWFGSQNPYKGRDPGGPLTNLAGVNEERGRVYVLLGKPDVIIFSDGLTETTSHDGSRSRLRFDQWVLEEWIYDKLYTYAVFRRSDSGGDWMLDSFQSNFVDLLEWAKLNWLQSDIQPNVTTWFRFSAAYGPSGIQVMVPVDRVSTDDRFQVELGVQVNVYRDGDKVDEIRDTKTIKESRENLFEGKNLRFGIPYTPGQKGEYMFDIIIHDLKASTPSKYRVLLKQTF